MSNRIIYPGAFDPITYGHIDLIERASRLFSQVVVAIAASASKKPLFTLAEREKIARDSLVQYSNVEVCTFSGLLVDLARSKEIMVILRGLRAITDFDYELQMTNLNRQMEPKIETVFLTPSIEYAYVSASMAREVAALKGDVSLLVPPAVQRALKNKLQ